MDSRLESSPAAAIPADRRAAFQPVRATGSTRSFGWGLLAIVVVALAVRLVFSFTAGQEQPLKGDAQAFHELAAHLADGDGYVSVSLGSDELRPSATHPPAFPVLLAALDLVGARSLGAHRVALALVGALGVGLLGLLGRRLAGSAVGLVAAAIAAVHPLWVEPGGVLMSEALHLVVVTAVLLLAVLVLEQATLPRLVGLGLVMGAAVLTRSESVLLVALIAVPLVFLAGRSPAARLRIGGVIVACLVVVVAPWIVRNEVQVASPTLSTNLGGTLTGSYCPRTFQPGDAYGGWSLACAFGSAAGVPRGPDEVQTEANLDGHLRTTALRFAGEHPAELPGVAAARVGRTWGLFHPGDQLSFDVGEGRPRSWQTVGQYVGWVLLVLAVVGAASLSRREWWRWWVVLMPIVAVTIETALIYGSTRMRISAEPSIALLAAFGVVTIAGRWVVPRFGAGGRRTAAVDAEGSAA
jgi:hypothetical protein